MLNNVETHVFVLWWFVFQMQCRLYREVFHTHIFREYLNAMKHNIEICHLKRRNVGSFIQLIQQEIYSIKTL